MFSFNFLITILLYQCAEQGEMLPKWELFSQNERQVARELKEIWLIEHFKNQEKRKEFLKEIMGFWTQNRQ